MYNNIRYCKVNITKEGEPEPEPNLGGEVLGLGTSRLSIFEQSLSDSLQPRH